jgi:hypothetical protein
VSWFEKHIKRLATYCREMEKSKQKFWWAIMNDEMQRPYISLGLVLPSGLLTIFETRKQAKIYQGRHGLQGPIAQVEIVKIRRPA